MPTPVESPGRAIGTDGPTPSARCFCLADEDTIRGFRLAGVPGRAVASPREAAEALAWAREQPDCGLLILTEDVMISLGPPLDALQAERSRPIVVAIPGPGGPKAGREDLRQLVQRAVGTSLEREP
jgi:vacuolar-type H+-ATPase subunit F/Vma7